MNAPRAPSPAPPTEALARARVRIGFAAAVVVFALAVPTSRSLALGAVVACVGEGLRIWAAGHLYKSREITRSGPYRYMRHPLYVGSAIMGAGLAVASASALATGLIAVYLGSTLAAAIKSEEAFLRGAFGDTYDRYRSGDALDNRSVRGFSARQAIANREHRTVAGLAAAILLLILKATYNGVFWGAAAGPP